MKAIARLVQLHFTLFPTQKWLAAAACGLLGLGAGVELAGGPGPVFAVFAAVLLILPMFLTLGAVFRTLSAPRTYGLLPWFRLRMLAATSLAVVLGTLITALFVRWAEGPDSAPLAVTLLYSFAVFSLLLWVPVFAPASLVVFVPLLIAALVPTLLGAAQAFDESEVFNVLLVVLPSGWAAFTLWFLRARSLGPHPIPARLTTVRPASAPDGTVQADAPGRPDYADAFHLRDRVDAEARPPHVKALPKPAHGAELSADTAAGAVLRGDLDSARKYWLASLTSLAWIMILLLVVDATTGYGGRGTLAAPFLFAAVLPFVVRVMVRRARLLWLRSASSRAELFRRIETGAMRVELPTALTLVVLAAAVSMLVTDVSSSAAAALTLTAAATAVAGAYLALMCVRARPVLELLAIAVYALTTGIGTVAVLAAPSRIDVLLAVTAAHAVAAMAFRTVAAHAWRSLDWLELGRARPPRRSAGGAVRA